MEALCSFSALASATLKAASSGLEGRVEACASGAGAVAVSAIVSVRWEGGREKNKTLRCLRNTLRSEGPVRSRNERSPQDMRKKRGHTKG